RIGRRRTGMNFVRTLSRLGRPSRVVRRDCRRGGTWPGVRKLLLPCLLVPLVTGLTAAAQRSPVPAARSTPRTAEGKPALSGFGRGPLLRNMDKNVPGGFKAIFTPAGAAAYQPNLTATINPEGLCLFAGIPRARFSGAPCEIVQARRRMVWLYELMWTFRSIPVDGRKLADAPEP